MVVTAASKVVMDLKEGDKTVTVLKVEVITHKAVLVFKAEATALKADLVFKAEVIALKVGAMVEAMVEAIRGVWVVGCLRGCKVVLAVHLVHHLGAVGMRPQHQLLCVHFPQRMHKITAI